MNSAESILRQIITKRLEAWSTSDLLEMLRAIQLSPDIYRPTGRTISLYIELARAELGRRSAPQLTPVPSTPGVVHDARGREDR